MNVKKKDRSSWIWILIGLIVAVLVIIYIATSTGSSENSDVNRTYVPGTVHPVAHLSQSPVIRT
jgi:flagellar basal body-associated protein FliL